MDGERHPFRHLTLSIRRLRGWPKERRCGPYLGVVVQSQACVDPCSLNSGQGEQYNDNASKASIDDSYIRLKSDGAVLLAVPNP